VIVNVPSTIVHMALAGLIATALLGRAFNRRSVGFILAVVLIIDLDSFVDVVAPYGHRVVLHNLVVPFAAGALVVVDVYVREESYILDRWGLWGYRVAWVTILCYVVAGVLLDLTDGVINVLWPIHDQFYTLDGYIELSDQRGLVQTFVEWGNNGAPTPEAVGTTENIEVTTGVDPGEPDTPDEDPERVFPVIGATWELILFLTGTFVTAMRLSLPGLPEDEPTDAE
jgi:inner membrane protein